MRVCVCVWVHVYVGVHACVWEDRAAGKVTEGKKQQSFSDLQTKGPFSWIHRPSHTSLAVFGKTLQLPEGAKP